jgi:exonuclease SbcC
VAAAGAALTRAQGAAARLPALTAAEATIVELDAQIAREAAAIADLDERMAALGPAPEVPLAPALVAAEGAVRAAEQRHREALTAHARAEQVLAAAQEAAARIADLERELAAAEQVAADWSLVARGLGRDGIQALLIDAAGPELTTLVNDLLRSCFGSRYTATISTTRAKKDGSGDKEVCDVLVYDAQHPEDGDREGREFSGGQRVILGEAIALALSAVSCRRAGLRDVTLVRDETGAALDEENARAYVAMLRRAAEVVGCSKVLFVSHNQATWALADARVHVRDGRVVAEGVEAAPPEQLAFEEGRAA